MVCKETPILFVNTLHKQDCARADDQNEFLFTRGEQAAPDWQHKDHFGGVDEAMHLSPSSDWASVGVETLAAESGSLLCRK